ncbi:MAG: hypothetical protein E6R05_05150 [Candidatus Moraniibacteriota bacterium]|nr:MAG: hypothetical protein E6R05_05150 [Candidatus Moranbacteria bacterium]
MKLSNSAVVGIGLVMVLAALPILGIVGDINGAILEQGRKGEMLMWPFFLALGLAWTGFGLCMHFGLNELNQPPTQ